MTWQLNLYSRRMAEGLLSAFPEEKLYSVQYAEELFQPDGTNRFVGAWLAEWLCPSGGRDFDVLVSTEAYLDGTGMLTVRWLNDHTHFANWAQEEGDPDLQNCKAFLAEVFSEKIWHVQLYREDERLIGRMLASDEIEAFLAETREERATHYEVKSWRGIYDDRRAL